MSRLYDEFELARRKVDALKELPLVAEQYRTAGQSAVDKRRILREPDTADAGVARLRVWHAERTLEWADRTGDDLRLARAEAEEDLQAAEEVEQEAQRKHDRAVNAIADAGADQTGAIRADLARVETEHHTVSQYRDEVSSRLAPYCQQLPSSSGDLMLLKESLTHVHASMADDERRLSEVHEEKIGEKQRLAALAIDQRAALKHAEQTRSNIPPEDDRRRQRIAAGCVRPASRLPFVGELLDIIPAHQGWEKAITSIVRPLAQDILVGARDFAAVRAWVNSHDQRGRVTLAPGRAGQPIRRHPDGTVPAMLDVADGPYQGWISGQLARFVYECVENDTDLDGDLRPDVVGRVTRSGMRTAPDGRVIKNDTLSDYRWIGRDNQALRAQLHARLDGTRLAYDDAARAVELAAQATKEHQSQMEGLLRLRDELAWPRLDLDSVERRLAELNQELTRLDTPENRKRRALFEATQTALFAAFTAVTTVRTKLDALELEEASTAFLRDLITEVLVHNAPLTEDERATTAALPYTAPDLSTVDHRSNVVDASLNARLQHSYRDAVNRLDEQIKNHDGQRETYERTLLAILRGYRNIDDKTARDVDDDIAALSTLEAIRGQLVTDDLPRTKAAWLKKIDRELNQGLRTLLSQIEVDTHDISRGLNPINRVLSGVPLPARVTTCDRTRGETQQ